MFTKLHKQPLRARDIMARRLITVSPDADVSEAIHLLIRHNISGMPVVDADGIYHGVFSEKCCMRVLCDTARLIVDPGTPCPKAKDFMDKRPFCLRPDLDIFDAIEALLQRRVSNALVTEPDGTFLGLFSERTAMNFVLEVAWNGLPTAEVRAFMNVEAGRLIDEDTDLLTIARMFIDTSYRRLPIVRDGRVLGQIGRRDVLRSSRILATIIRHQFDVAEENAVPCNDSLIFLEAHQRLPCADVKTFMDKDARTITEDHDLLAMAQIFKTTPYRRLPVIRDGRVVGQVSRRDILAPICQLTDRPPEPPVAQSLYLSAVRNVRAAAVT